MSLSVSYALELTGYETVDVGVPDVSDAELVHDAWNQRGTLDDVTVPAATNLASLEVTLTAGTANIDLTNMEGINGTTIDGTGLKIQAIRFLVPAANENPLKIVPGTSNGYNLFGAGCQLILQPGDDIVYRGNDSTPTIASGAKILTLSDDGAADAETYRVQIVMGPPTV